MNISIRVIFIITALLGIFPVDAVYAKTVRLEISPKVIRQGDAFVVKVTGLRNKAQPTVTIEEKPINVSTCGEGCFIGIGAVGVDEKPGVYRVKVTAGKMSKKVSVTVKKASVRTITLSLPEEKVIVSPDDLAIVEEENAILDALFLTVSERLWEGVFCIPSNNEISTAFGTRRIMNNTWTSIHRGVDIRGSEGDEVRASNNGKVVLSRELFFGGKTIILDHGQGVHSVYMHLSCMNVQPGEMVSKGDVIGLIGSTGRATGPHLHFGVKISNISVNPLSVLKLNL